MFFKVFVSLQQLEILKTGKHLKGSLHLERASNGELVLSFNHYRPMKPHRPDNTLLALPHGAIRKSAQRYRLNLSLPDNLGEARVGELMRLESAEAESFMRALEQVLKV
jgi:hypothetical protein